MYIFMYNKFISLILFHFLCVQQITMFLASPGAAAVCECWGTVSVRTPGRPTHGLPRSSPATADDPRGSRQSSPGDPDTWSASLPTTGKILATNQPFCWWWVQYFQMYPYFLPRCTCRYCIIVFFLIYKIESPGPTVRLCCVVAF